MRSSSLRLWLYNEDEEVLEIFQADQIHFFGRNDANEIQTESIGNRQ